MLKKIDIYRNTVLHKYCNRTSTLINTNKLVLSVASQQLSNDVLLPVRRRQQVDSAVPTDSSL